MAIVSRIIHKLGVGVPATGDLEVGELAQDRITGDLYGKTDDGDIFKVGTAGDDPDSGYDDTELRADLNQEIQDRIDGDASLAGDISTLNTALSTETEARIQGDADLNTRIDNLDLSGGDEYDHWKIQGGISDTPYSVTSKSLLTFEGADGINISRSGNYITFSYQGADLSDSYDNYQWWRFAIDGSNTTNIMSQQTIDFRAGDNVSIVKGTAGANYTITISAQVPTVDLTGYYTKSQSDARFYPKDGIWIGTETQYINLSNKQPNVLYFCT